MTARSLRHPSRIMNYTAVRPQPPSYELTGPEGPRLQT
jgi:hypothetical protein